MKTPSNEAFLAVRVTKLHALIGSPIATESKSARRKLDKLLKERGKTWNDIFDLPTLGNAILNKKNKNIGRQEEEGNEHAADHQIPIPDVFELIFFTLKRYLYLTDNELVALTLWILHTYVFERFAITPRLFLTSAVRECGKTTVLNLLDWIASCPERHDDPSVAALY